MKTKVYFASDQHFGAPDFEKSKEREVKFVRWLEMIQFDAKALFLLGDLFDFWFEYDKVVPKGFVRVLGKLAQLSDAGLPIYFFVGNHDLWMRDYFQKELNIPVYHHPKIFEFFKKKIYIAHGDGLGPADFGYKRMKKVFTNPFCKWLFKWLHPDLGVGLAQYLSTKNKLISGEKNVAFLKEDKEWLVQYTKKKLTENRCDYFIFGHRHLPMKIDLEQQVTYINIGDWVTHFTYGVFDGQEFLLEKFK